MVTAIDMRLATNPVSQGLGFSCQEWLHLAKDAPEHQFIFIVYDEQAAAAIEALPNLRVVAAGKPQLWQWWYQFRLYRLLRRYNVSLFVGASGYAAPAGKTALCLILNDHISPHHPVLYPAAQQRSMHKKMPSLLQTAAVVITTSAHTLQAVQAQYPAAANKLTLVQPQVSPAFVPKDWEQREQVKAEQTAGKEYFVAAGPAVAEDWLQLLKAFSLFKKRQKSNLQLLLTGPAATPDSPLAASLQTYKYRQDVQLLGILPEAAFARLLGAAYALVQPGRYDGYLHTVSQALHCCVPVIVPDSGVLPGLCGAAGLYFPPGNLEQLAAQLMLVYKNEDLRNQLIVAAPQVLSNATPGLLWQTLVTAAGSKRN